MAAARKLSPLQALEDEMLEAIARETGVKPEWARTFVAPIIRHLVSEYGGERLYIPKRREYDVDEVLAFFHRVHGDVERTCREFSISRRTLYRLLPERGGEG